MTLSLFAGQGPSSSRLPLLVVTTQEPTAMEKRLPDLWLNVDHLKLNGTSPEEELRKAVAQGYVLHDFKDFRIIYAPNTFNLRDAKRQTDLLSRLANADLAKPLQIEQLTREDQKTLRGMFPVLEPAAEDAEPGANGKLRFYATTVGTMKIKNGGSEFDVWLRPKGPPLSDLDPYLSESSKEGRVALDPSYAAAPIPSNLSILFPGDHSSMLQRLEWTGQIREHFTKLCQEARDAYQQEVQRMMSRVKALLPSPFQKEPEGMPKMSDFTPEEQHRHAQPFHSQNRGRFGSQDEAHRFLVNSDTLRFQEDFVLVSKFAKERGQGNAVTQPFYLVFRCPIGP